MLQAGKSWIGGMQKSTSKEITTTTVLFSKFLVTRLTNNVKTFQSETELSNLFEERRTYLQKVDRKGFM